MLGTVGSCTQKGTESKKRSTFKAVVITAISFGKPNSCNYITLLFCFYVKGVHEKTHVLYSQFQWQNAPRPPPRGTRLHKHPHVYDPSYTYDMYYSCTVSLMWYNQSTIMFWFLICHLSWNSVSVSETEIQHFLLYVHDLYLNWRIVGVAPLIYFDTQDYPSVGQIIDLLTQFEVVAIFSIAQDKLPTYQVLQYTLWKSFLQYKL